MLDGYGKRVLVVDDDESILNILVSLLNQAGYNVLAAKDGESALEEMRRRHFDLVVTDYHMPRIDGITFLLRSRRIWPQTPVILTSADQTDMSEIAVRNGAYAWVRKPYEVSLLLEMVRAAVQHLGETAPHNADTATAV
jgi:DNA-binding response OmpR family regulator